MAEVTLPEVMTQYISDLGMIIMLITSQKYGSWNRIQQPGEDDIGVCETEFLP